MSMNQALNQLLYIIHLFIRLPYTFFKIIVLGKDSLWKQWFWESWGFLPDGLKKLVKKRPTIWINTAAGGELTQSVSFCKHLKRNFPGHNLILSTHNYQAYKFATEKIMGVDWFFFSPWDVGFVCHQILDKIQPVLLLSIEATYSPILLKKARSMGYLSMLCSGFMGKGYHRHPAIKRSIDLEYYHYFDYLGVKDQESLEGFVKLEVQPDKVHILGNLKYDAEFIRLSDEDKRNMREKIGVNEKTPLLVSGSTRPGEEKILIDTLTKLRDIIPNLKLILAPRFNNFIPEAENYLREKNITYILRSDITGTGPINETVVVVDTFGELNHLYGIADFIFIGGSITPSTVLGYGSNIIEPLIHKNPILFGPYMAHWTEIIQKFKSIYPGLEVRNSRDLYDGITFLFSHPGISTKLRDMAERIVDENRGGIEKHVRFIREILTSGNSAGY